jgi:hypothetical protein
MEAKTLQDCINYNKETIEAIKKSSIEKYGNSNGLQGLSIIKCENPYDEIYNILSQYYNAQIDYVFYVAENTKLRKEIIDLKAERMALLENNHNTEIQKVDVNTYSTMFKPCTKKGNEEFENLKLENEIVRAGEVYPNLFTQANYSMDEVNKIKDEIIDQVKDFFSSFGDSVSNHLLDNVYNNLQVRLEEDGAEGFDEEQITNILNGTYTMTKAASMLNEMSNSLDRMKIWSGRVEFAKKGVLL